MENPSSGSGQATYTKTFDPGGDKTIYVGGVYEVDKTSGGTVTRTVTYYPAAGAMRVNGTLYYVLKDHLGSASVVTDSTGTIVGEQRYYPYGETRVTSGTIYTDKLFTGQREMAGLGIYHYGARFYSPKLGRFLSADTIVPNLYNPQDLNRFSYVRNNPLRYTDPTGHYVYCNENDGDICEHESAPNPAPGSTYGLVFEHDRNDDDLADDIQAFVTAVTQEANAMYEVFCEPAFEEDCGFSSPAELYVATHGTTVITFSNSSTTMLCERNAFPGQEGVICGSNSRGDIDPILAAHEMGHVVNALIHNNGYVTDDPYHDLADERVNNLNFPPIDVDITPGYGNNCCSPGEDFGNMYSMWVFDDWPDSAGGAERREFMNNNMYMWILQMLNP